MKFQDVKPILNTLEPKENISVKPCDAQAEFHTRFYSRAEQLHMWCPTSKSWCVGGCGSAGLVALHKLMELYLYQVVVVAHNPTFIFCLVETMSLDQMLSLHLQCLKSVEISNWLTYTYWRIGYKGFLIWLCSFSVYLFKCGGGETIWATCSCPVPAKKPLVRGLLNASAVLWLVLEGVFAAGFLCGLLVCVSYCTEDLHNV